MLLKKPTKIKSIFSWIFDLIGKIFGLIGKIIK